MKLLKLRGQLRNAKLLIAKLTLTLTLSGCVKKDAVIAIHDSFCEGRFETQILSKRDYDNLDSIRTANPDWKITLDKIIDNKTINEKEFEACQSLVEPQPQN